MEVGATSEPYWEGVSKTSSNESTPETVGKYEVERKRRANFDEELAAGRLDETLPNQIRTWIHMSEPSPDAAIPTVRELEQGMKDAGTVSTPGVLRSLFSPWEI